MTCRNSLAWLRGSFGRHKLLPSSWILFWLHLDPQPNMQINLGDLPFTHTLHSRRHTRTTSCLSSTRGSAHIPHRSLTEQIERMHKQDQINDIRHLTQPTASLCLCVFSSRTAVHIMIDVVAISSRSICFRALLLTSGQLNLFSHTSDLVRPLPVSFAIPTPFPSKHTPTLFALIKANRQ
jgi:hypothetical protein